MSKSLVSGQNIISIFAKNYSPVQNLKIFFCCKMKQTIASMNTQSEAESDFNHI